jgi:hypothetical protein
MQNGEPRQSPADGTNNGIGDRVITTEHDRPSAARENATHRNIDRGAGILAIECDVTDVGQHVRRRNVDKIFGPRISSRRDKRLANLRRSSGGTPPKRRRGVVRHAKERRGAERRHGSQRNPLGNGYQRNVGLRLA